MRVVFCTLCLCLVGCSSAPPALLVRAEAVPTASPQDRFVEAAARGDFGEVDRRLLAADVAIDGVGAEGITALLAAIDRGEAAMTKRLLDGGASVEREAGGRRPLVASADAAVGAEAIAKALLAAGADPNRADPSGRRALTEHARRGHLSTIDALLAAGATVDAVDTDGVSPLHAASVAGHAQVVQRLLTAGANPRLPDRDGTSPLFVAAARGHAAVVELLLEAGAEPNRADTRARLPLGAALAGGHHEVARVLLQSGSSPDAAVWPPEGSGLVVVAARGDIEGAALLYAAGATLVSLPGHTSPLMAAARAGRVSMVRWLLSRKTPTSTVDAEGRTALHHAAQTGQATIVQLLLDTGADPERLDVRGHRALDLARAAGHERVVRILDTPTP